MVVGAEKWCKTKRMLKGQEKHSCSKVVAVQLEIIQTNWQQFAYLRCHVAKRIEHSDLKSKSEE